MRPLSTVPICQHGEPAEHCCNEHVASLETSEHTMNYRTLESIRDKDGKLPAYAWPGGYPILYHDDDGEVYCPRCANQTDDIELINFIHWEGPFMNCCECMQVLESAYGDLRCIPHHLHHHIRPGGLS